MNASQTGKGSNREDAPSILDSYLELRRSERFRNKKVTKGSNDPFASMNIADDSITTSFRDTPKKVAAKVRNLGNPLRKA